MRVIVRCERPRPGAPLRSEDVDGYRLTAFAANTTRGQLADLEVRHRRRARGEGRILRLTDRSRWADRKSTRLNSSHVAISYAVFCLKKKNTIKHLSIEERQLLHKHR